MVGHKVDTIMSLMAGWTTGWDVPLQGKKILIIQIPSSLNMWMKILFAQARLELQDYAQEPVHTLCTQMNSQTGPFVHSVMGSESVTQAERKKSRWLALRLLFLL